MPRRGSGRIGPALAALAVGMVGASALAADAVKTVDTPGQGRLIMCRDWLVYTSCWHYSHIAIPAQVKIGDTLDLSFGSSNKEMTFPVERILRDGDRCEIYNTPDGATKKVNRIRVEPCKPGAK